MSKMKWSYKTVHFELKREGLLGGSFLDETEIEEQLNNFGRSGWELISVIEVQDGIITFFKQSLDIGLSSMSQEDIEPEGDEIQEAEDVYQGNEVRGNDDVYEADEIQDGDVYEVDAVLETDAAYDDELYPADDKGSAEFEPDEDYHSHLEEEELTDQEDDTYATSAREDDYDEIVEEAQVEHGDQDVNDEQQEYDNNKGIGAIRIE
ncbi:MAG: DUF4177 domain-containing protein [Desulfobulbia bacterium]